METTKAVYDKVIPVCSPGGKAGRSFSLASVDKGNVILETVKAAESGEGTVFRMYESENALTKAALTVNMDFSKAYVCNLLEEEVEEAKVEGNKIMVACKPYEIVTVKIL